MTISGCPELFYMLKDKNISISRAELACWSGGRAGLCSLLPQPKLPTELTQFHQATITNWLQRELAPFSPNVAAANCKYTLSFSQGPKLQLRFVPRYSRWMLLVKRQGYWWPHVPAKNKRCLALTDWLGQVRQIVTGRIDIDDTPGPR